MCERPIWREQVLVQRPSGAQHGGAAAQTDAADAPASPPHDHSSFGCLTRPSTVLPRAFCPPFSRATLSGKQGVFGIHADLSNTAGSVRRRIISEGGLGSWCRIDIIDDHGPRMEESVTLGMMDLDFDEPITICSEERGGMCAQPQCPPASPPPGCTCVILCVELSSNDELPFDLLIGFRAMTRSND